jgi:hypothetical protein
MMTGSAQSAAARCDECDNLWDENSDALDEYLRIIAERNAARKPQDDDLVEAFERIEKESFERCQNAQQAIFNHEVYAHRNNSVRVLDFALGSGADCVRDPTKGGLCEASPENRNSFS